MNNPAPEGHNEMSPYDELLESVTKAEDQASKCKVENREDADNATFLIKAIREVIKKGGAAKAEEKAPHLQANKTIEAKYKPLIERLTDANRIIQNHLNPFILAEKKKANDLARAEMEAAKEKADEIGIDAPPPMKKPAYKHTTATGQTASTREVWAWEVDDELEIPDEFYIIDAKKINAAVKSGARKIPGIKIFSKTITVVR